MGHLSRLGRRFHIPVRPDSDGYIGRECPMPECRGYFKITPGTGLSGPNLPCYCPYCGHSAAHQHFATGEQIRYGRSVVKRKVVDAVRKDLKRLEFDHRGAFGMRFSMRVQARAPVPVWYYREKQLETEITCERCTLRYAVYGEFAFYPDCGVHNSLQILTKNLELVEKQVALADTVDDPALSAHLIGDALENVVSAFDGFGRETCRLHAKSAARPDKAENVSFQDFIGAQRRVQKLFGFDFAAGVDAPDWELACRCFQKRHVLAHKMGVIDEAYVGATGDSHAVVGRKVSVQSDEVTAVAAVINRLGGNLKVSLECVGGGAKP
jgi:hypothetical protein